VARIFCVAWRKYDRRIADQARWRAIVLRGGAALAYTSASLAQFDHTSRNMPAMTRTPTITVTANAFAARAFAWGFFLGAHLSDIEPGTPPPLH
jgi:hypothetical protein